MSDPRIRTYTTLAERMARGEFPHEVDVGGNEDELARLGRSLLHLGSALEHRFDELRTLQHITEQINSGIMLDEVLHYVYDAFRPVLPYDRIGLALLEDQNRVLRARWARSESDHLEITGGYAGSMTGSSLQAVLHTGAPRILNDLEQHLAEHPGSDSTARIVREGMRSSLTCPLIARGKPIGFMFFSSRQTGTYQHVHVETFQQLAGQLALVVEKGRLYQELLQMNELKTRFLGMAAHDLRNPLCVLTGYLDLLLGDEGRDLRPDQRELLQEMQSACGTMVDLVETFLDISAIESGRLTLHTVRSALDSLSLGWERDATRIAHAKGIRLQRVLEPGLGEWTFDPYRIRQVVQNLLSNAIKYSPRGSTIILRLQRVGAALEISVTDQGVGIPLDEQSRLFQDFSRTSAQPTGGEKSIGLGLAICRRIVEAHGGSMRVDSQPGKGSTFYARLP